AGNTGSGWSSTTAPECGREQTRRPQEGRARTPGTGGGQNGSLCWSCIPLYSGRWISFAGYRLTVYKTNEPFSAAGPATARSDRRLACRQGNSDRQAACRYEQLRLLETKESTMLRRCCLGVLFVLGVLTLPARGQVQLQWKFKPEETFYVETVSKLK